VTEDPGGTLVNFPGLPLHYRLEDKIPVPEPDPVAYAQWEQTADRTVARTEMADGALEISTVFLGRNLAWLNASATPQFFETMTFTHGDPSLFPEYDSRVWWRYATWEEAEAAHTWIVDYLASLLRSR
jgi:hypothetical protein